MFVCFFQFRLIIFRSDIKTTLCLDLLFLQHTYILGSGTRLLNSVRRGDKFTEYINESNVNKGQKVTLDFVFGPSNVSQSEGAARGTRDLRVSETLAAVLQKYK